MKLEESILYTIYAVVDEIPFGKVATYGQIASLIGKTKNARLIGKALSLSAYYGNYPCHRVVNHAGRLVPGWVEQRALLEEEGIYFTKEGYVSLRKYQWNRKS